MVAWGLDFEVGRPSKLLAFAKVVAFAFIDPSSTGPLASVASPSMAVPFTEEPSGVPSALAIASAIQRQ